MRSLIPEMKFMAAPNLVTTKLHARMQVNLKKENETVSVSLVLSPTKVSESCLACMRVHLTKRKPLKACKCLAQLSAKHRNGKKTGAMWANFAFLCLCGQM